MTNKQALDALDRIHSENKWFDDDDYNIIRTALTQPNQALVEHDRRVTELLEANNAEVERRRKAEAEVTRLTKRLNGLGYDK